MSAIRPATYHAWLLLVKKNRLRLGPLEGMGESLVNHALARSSNRASYGFWDHQSNTGFIDMEQGNLQLRERDTVSPAPPVPADDPDWK